MSEVSDVDERQMLQRRTFSIIAAVAGATTLVAASLIVYGRTLAPSPVLVVDRAAIAVPVDTVPVDVVPIEAATVGHEPPFWITVDDIELWSPIRSVGVEDNGELEVPDEAVVGWYQYGSAPGHPGATVFAAHVTWKNKIGPFFKLGELEPGARIDVGLGDGTIRTYEVFERVMYLKDELPRDRIWTTTGDETLVLITCGGSYNPEIRRYRHNIVVYAAPVAVTDLPALT